MKTTKHINMLGLKVKDAVTGFNGVVTTVSFELYGCVQAVVTPPANSDGEVKAGRWFDVTRLKIIDSKPVMALPNFEEGYIADGKKGCAVKPLP